MHAEPQPIDISDSSDLLNLAEDVQRSGIGRVLKRGEQELALVTPIAPPPRTKSRARRPATPATPDTILNIIGIGESDEPTDISRHEADYLAEAYLSASQ